MERKPHTPLTEDLLHVFHKQKTFHRSPIDRISATGPLLKKNVLKFWHIKKRFTFYGRPTRRLFSNIDRRPVE